MSGGNSHDRKKFETAVEREVAKRLRETRNNSPTDIQEPTKLPRQGSRLAKPKGIGSRLAEHLRTVEAVSFVLAIGAILMADYFWWFVAFTYIGLIVEIIHCFMDRGVGWSRYVTGMLFVLIAALFTSKAVWGSAYFESTGQWTEGNYDIGSHVHGITWQSDWSELQFSISNNSPADMKDFDLEFLVEEAVEDLVIDNDVGCKVFKSGVHPIDATISSSDGRQQLLTSVGYKGRYRLACEKIPSHTGISLIIALGNMDPIANSIFGLRPQPRGVGESLLGPKRKPKWVRYHASYKVGLRPYAFNGQVNPAQY